MAARAFDFIFEEEGKIEKKKLMQGDLLVRTPELANAIRQAHAHYANAPSYSHFLVLTQSCDLVQRKGRCKAPYITICAVRPLSIAVSREVEKYLSPIDGCPIPIGSSESEILVKQYLERVLNNTVDGIFFIPKSSAYTVNDHLCAFLALSIALKPEHYSICTSSKVAQARPIFGAKVGSLASNIYGRIATPDMSEEYGQEAAKAYKDEFFNDLGMSGMVWLTPYQKEQLKLELKNNDPNIELDVRRIQEILEKMPTPRDLLAERAVEVLLRRGLIAVPEGTNVEDETEKAEALAAAAQKAKNFIKNDQAITNLMKMS